jgi:hypothetical protein
MIKLNVDTYGKIDAIKLNPADLLATLPEFTGRVDRTEEQIQAKVDSLLKVGQIHSVLYRLNEDREPVLITGVTRTLAAQRITEQGLTDANGVTYGKKNPFVLKGELKSAKGNKPLSYLDALFLTFAENNGDLIAPVTMEDEIAFVVFLTAQGLSAQQISDGLSKNLAWVTKRLSADTLDADSKAKLNAGEISLDTAVTLTNIKPEKRAAAVEAAQKADGKVTNAGLAEAARQLGASTKVTKRSEKQKNEWLKSAIENTAVGPLQSFLFAQSDFNKGIISVDEMNAALATLEAALNGETAIAAA